MLYLVVNKAGNFRIFSSKPEKLNDFWHYEDDLGERIFRGILSDRMQGLTWDSKPILITTCL